MMVQKLDKKTVNGIIVEGEPSPTTAFEQQQIVQLITEIAKRLIREKKSDVTKSA